MLVNFILRLWEWVSIPLPEKLIQVCIGYYFSSLSVGKLWRSYPPIPLSNILTNHDGEITESEGLMHSSQTP